SGGYQLAGRIAQVPEGRQLFPNMSVDDNLRVGAWTVPNRDPARVYELFPELAGLKRRRAGTLSGGEQQMVAVGRALMSQPDLLAVDELSFGLAPRIVTRLAEFLVQLNREQGMSVLLVEQNERLARALCDRVYMLESGRVVVQSDALPVRPAA